jgi:hypothetical protein
VWTALGRREKEKAAFSSEKRVEEVVLLEKAMAEPAAVHITELLRTPRKKLAHTG